MDQIDENQHFSALTEPLPHQQESSGLAQEEPNRGVEERDLASQLSLLQTFGLLCVVGL
jgi:hypothetical protein